MALDFNDPYGGGVPDIDLGQSKITPRETYSTNPRALNEQYEDKMQNSAKLFAALSKFTGAVGDVEKQQQQKEVDQAGVLAAQVGDSIKDGENVDLKLGTLLPDHSPLARSAVAEIIGKQRGQADAQAIYENMPLEARNDPAAAQAYFNQKLKESATQYAGSPFYNNARTAAMRQLFAGASTTLSNQRNAVMKDTFTQDAKQQTQDKADQIAHDYEQNPDKYAPSNWRSDKILSSPIGDRVKAAAKAAGIDPVVMAKIIHIESGGDPNAGASTSYKGLGQLNTSEFAKYGDPGKSILDVDANLTATARSLADKSQQFTKQFGRPPTATELYMMHQQGEAGLRSHLKNPDQPAWQSMLQTGEGKQKGEGWARKAIWGNIAVPDRAKFGGSVDNVSSKDFLGYWSRKLGDDGSPIAPKNTAVASADPSFVPGSTDAAAPGSAPADGTTVVADASSTGPKAKPVYDYAGRPEGELPPQVKTLRDELFTLDKMQDFTHPTVANAEKRDNMVQAVMTVAQRTGNADWLKAIPNSVLTPDLRTTLVKAEKQIGTDNYTKAEHARTEAENQRKDAMRDWNTKANAYIIDNPGAPPPPQMVVDAMKIDPSLLESFNQRRDAVVKGLTNPRVEDDKVQAYESKILDIAAAGGDPRNVDVNGVLDPAKHQHLLDFQMEAKKAGGELSNGFYDKTWSKDAQTLYGFQYGVPLQGGQKSNPDQIATEHDFHKNLAKQIAIYTAQNGAPFNNSQRMDIYEKALDETQRIHRPTNVDGARVSGQGSLPDTATSEALKRAQKKYNLGAE